MRALVGVLLLAVVAGTASASGATAALGSGVTRTGKATEAAKASHYRNPVRFRDFPDPDVIRAPSGRYYAYGTERNTARGQINIQIAESRHLVHWRYVGDAIATLPRWGDKKEISWAPQVVRKRSRYYLYYTIVPNRLRHEFGLCLAVATSRSPAGPFVSKKRPFYCGPTIADLDPDVFRDPATGYWQVYWGSDGDIVTARLGSSMTDLAAPGAAPTLLLRGRSARVQRPYEDGIEAPFMWARNGWYYLFYSGDDCCSYPPHYATMVARSRHATGPFRRFAATRPGLSSVILHANKRWAGPGHNSVIRDQAGHDWMVYHAIDTTHPYIPGGATVRRAMLIDRIHYRLGWPRITHNSPSIERRQAPITR